MKQPLPAIMINQRREPNVHPNIAPLFLGPHRSFGLFVGSTIIDYRIAIMSDHRDGAGWQEIVSLVYQNTGSLYQDILEYGGPDAFLAFVLSRIAETGRMLPDPTDAERAVITTGLTQTFEPLEPTPYPTDETSALAWIESELSRKQWTLESGYLELI